MMRCSLFLCPLFFDFLQKPQNLGPGHQLAPSPLFHSHSSSWFLPGVLSRGRLSHGWLAGTEAVLVCDGSQVGPPAELGPGWRLAKGETSLHQPASPEGSKGHEVPEELVPSRPEPFSGLTASWVLVFLNRRPQWGVQRTPGWPRLMMAAGFKTLESAFSNKA